ncbi:hypothetical protein D3C80_796600 [compost metagenome]
MAQLAGGQAAGACPGQGHHRLHRGGHRRGAGRGREAAARDRRAADGRHERGRRPVRRRQDVPAPGGEVGAGDEAGGRLPATLHRGGEVRRLQQRQDSDGHRQGGRARHRQEHRRRGAAVQQLRDRRSRGHGLLRDHPQDGAGSGGRHHRPVRPHHSVPGRDGARGERDGAPGLQAAALDRRRHHLQGPHRGEDRAELLGARGLCVERLPRGGGGPEPAEPRAQARLRRPHRQGVRDSAGSACPQAAALQAGLPGPRPRQPPAAGLGRL